MSFQITVLKVLAGHPEGQASLVDLKHYVAVLSCSGADWSQRMKCLAARAPDLDIFSNGYVLRDTAGWQITDAGRAFLKMIEAPVTEPDLVEPEMQRPVAVRAQAVQPVQNEQITRSGVAPNVIRIAEHRARRRRRAA